MRSFLVLMVLVAAGCTSDTVGQDTAFRRLVDSYDSEAQCVAEGDFAVCYQTLTLCTNGRVTLDLVNRPTSGEYSLSGSTAFAEFLDMSVEFDLDARRSAQLPGRNPWQLVEPITYDCD